MKKNSIAKAVAILAIIAIIGIAIAPALIQ